MMKFSRIVGCILCSTALLLSGCGATITESVGGTVAGLSGGTTVVLLNNGTDALTVSANGTFTFDTQIDAGSAYDVTVEDNPTGETCTVTSGTGTVSSTTGAVTNVAVACTANLTNYNYVEGTVSGLATDTSVTLSDGTSGGSVTVSTNGTFSFPTELLVGTAYSVTVTTTPSGKTCTVTNGSGAVPIDGTLTAVVVTCS